MQLTDWPDGARRPRDILIPMAYLRAAWRGNVRCGWIFTPDEVAQHDWWTSTACGQLVPREWDAAQLATAPAYTFRVPWADGGRCDKANARLAHYGCAAFADPCLARALARVLIRDLAVRTRASRTDTHCLNGHRLAGDNLRISDARA